MAGGRGKYRWTVGRLMGLIAALAALLAAGLYRRENLDVDAATVTANVRGLRRGDVDARRRAAGDLSRIAPADPGPVEAALAEAALGDADVGVRAAAVHSLEWVVRQGRVGQPPGAIGRSDPGFLPARAFLRVLADPDAGVRRAAVVGAATVREAGLVDSPLAAAIESRLFGLLDDGDPAIRASAIMALGWTKPPPDAARARALALLDRDPEPQVRRGAVTALVAGWPSPELYPALLARRDRLADPAERDWILRCLAEFVTPAPGSIPALVGLMDADESAARRVPGVLARLGRGARPWLGALARVAEHELAGPIGDAPAVHALVRIDPDAPETRAILPAIAGRLRDPTVDDPERAACTRILDRCGPSGAPAVPALRAALASPLPDVRTDAARLLGGIGPAAAPAIPDLETIARDDPAPAARAAAARALEKLRPAAP